MLGKCCCLKTTLHTVVVGLFFSLLQTIFVSYTCFSLHATQNLHLKLPIIHRMKWGVGKLLSPVWLFGTPCTVACQAPQSMGFSWQEYWSGFPFPSPGNLPNPEIEPGSLTLKADCCPSHQGILFEVTNHSQSIDQLGCFITDFLILIFMGKIKNVALNTFNSRYYCTKCLSLFL